MVKFGLPLLAALALALASLSVARMTPNLPPAEPPSAPPRAAFQREIGAVGLVEARTENINLSLPVPGLVTQVYVQAGDRVRRGQKLFSLDDRDLRAELALRQSARDLAKAKLAKMEAGTRAEEIPPSEARVKEAEALLSDAQVQLQLMESVRDKRAIRDEDLQRRRRAVDAAKARLEEASASLKLLRAGSWERDIEIARAELKQAERQIDRTQIDIERMTVTSPIDGQVLQCKVRAGEYAQAGVLAQPLLMLGAVDRMHVRTDIDEKDAARFLPGSKAIASVRGAAGQRYTLAYVRTEPYVVPKKNLTGDSTERIDTRVLQVIYALDPGAPVYTGQQMDVFIEAKGARP